MNEDIPKQIQAAFDILPKTLKQEEVEGLLMAVAQAYAPTLQDAIVALLNSRIILQELKETIEEASTATKQ